MTWLVKVDQTLKSWMSSLFDPPWPPLQSWWWWILQSNKWGSQSHTPCIPVWHATFPVVSMENKRDRSGNKPPRSAPNRYNVHTYSWHLNQRHIATDALASNSIVPSYKKIRKGGPIPERHQSRLEPKFKAVSQIHPLVWEGPAVTYMSIYRPKQKHMPPFQSDKGTVKCCQWSAG